jgi:hypothetical protein
VYGPAVDILVSGSEYPDLYHEKWTLTEQEQFVRSLRRQGLAAWLRPKTLGLFSETHIHLIDPIVPNLGNCGGITQYNAFLAHKSGLGRRWNKLNFISITGEEEAAVRGRRKRHLR